MKTETLCEPGQPDKINEDAVVLVQDGDTLIAAAIDGVTARIPAQAITPLLTDDGAQNGASWVAAMTAAAIRHGDASSTPRDLLIAANDAVRAKLETIYGPLTGANIRAKEPELAAFSDDVRYMRSVLPACVVTVAQIDTANKTLDYAQAGDTSLLLFNQDRSVTVAAGDDGRTQGSRLLARARQIQVERNLPSLDDALDDPAIRRAMQEGGIWLNYVDEHGQTQPGRGVGAVNGLPQLADYITVGMVDLTEVVGVVVCTDGVMWPAVVDESAMQVVNRLRGMRHLIETSGLRGYYQHLRIEEKTDADREHYPRFKIHDDAGAVYVNFRD